MRTLRSVFAILPAAAGVDCALNAYKALPLADRSKLIGLHVSPLANTYGLGADIVVAGYIEAQIEAAEEEKRTTEAAFKEACEKAGIVYEWRAKSALSYILSPEAGAMARAADLILFPRLPEAASVGRHRFEELVVAAGRPVLGVPAEWSGGVLGERVLIAWDGGREAARAVFDALPLLVSARAVRIVSVQGFLEEPIRQFTLGDDIAATLSRHGVRAESHTFQSSRGSVKEELRAQMLDTGADVIVMGCYGHSRVREMILGGVSREMLKDASIPLLLSS
jgi:nucleotide-binding universal stress UspA family protein